MGTSSCGGKRSGPRCREAAVTRGGPVDAVTLRRVVYRRYTPKPVAVVSASTPERFVARYAGGINESTEFCSVLAAPGVPKDPWVGWDRHSCLSVARECGGVPAPAERATIPGG